MQGPSKSPLPRATFGRVSESLLSSVFSLMLMRLDKPDKPHFFRPVAPQQSRKFPVNYAGLCAVDAFDVCCDGWKPGMCRVSSSETVMFDSNLVYKKMPGNHDGPHAHTHVHIQWVMHHDVEQSSLVDRKR